MTWLSTYFLVSSGVGPSEIRYFPANQMEIDVQGREITATLQDNELQVSIRKVEPLSVFTGRTNLFTFFQR